MGNLLNKAGPSPREVIEEAEQIFFEAMLTDDRHWGSKDDVWRVVKNLVFGTYGHSAAFVAMFRNGRPFWQMHCQGYWEDQALPILSKALLKNYQQRIFRGGRGPGRFEQRVADGTMLYQNINDIGQKREDLTLFDNFRGEETVTHLRHDDQGRFASGEYRTPLGSGRYQGMRLFQFDE
ncbi:hypothetical protein HY091_02610 [Candidatus Kaiserbacteria bacterium]|nr:hypothetical protein [Candidatus Kaiserbacteria bacterium]